VEGATAAMCYVFKSLMTNRLLQKGDTIALGTPIFTPYIEMPHLPEFALQTVEIRQSERVDGRHTWQYPPEEIRKLEDPRIKAFFLVNPSNPASHAMRDDTYAQIVELVRTKRQDLIVLTDDVYGTFAEGFRSLAAELPHNTILVYSYSKLFGCTGVRLGVVALHEDNVIDRRIAALPLAEREALNQRYASLVQDPGALRFIDRMVADSRDVALNHTAGLSLPQQVQMALFSLFVLLDEDNSYIERCREILRERLDRLMAGLGLAVPDDPLRCGYYVDIDLEAWARKAGGDEFMRYVETHREPLDVVIGLARNYGMVLLNGSGFAGPAWSVRISLANLDADDYATIGRNLAHVMRRAIDRWRGSGDADKRESQESYAAGPGAQGASPR
jgi:aspartate 4-decarboxylase